MDPKIINDLQSLNFSPNEAKVYAAIVEIGQTSAGALIKKTGLHRSVVYETLDKLIARKLVFKLKKGNITFFQPTDPQRLVQNVKSQEEIALNLVPKLEHLLKAKLPEITVYEGVEAYKRFWMDSVKRMPVGAIDYGAGSVGHQWWDYMGKDVEKYFKLCLQRKIKWKMIVFTRDQKDSSLLDKYPTFTEQRIIEKGAVSEGNFNVLGDESVVLHSATEPMIIEVKNPTLVRVFQNIFDLLWGIGRPIVS